MGFVTSDKPEVTSASSHLTPSTIKANEKISTSLKTKQPANRRDGVSYSSSVIHRDPNHPEQDAASSIDFRLNTDVKGSSIHNDKPSASYYTTPKYDFHPQSSEYSGSSQVQPEDQPHSSHESNDDVIYGKNAAQATSTFHFEQGHQGLQSVGHRGVLSHTHDQSPHSSQHTHPNHQPFYKQVYAQPVFTETNHKIEVQHPTTQFKRVLSTPRPKTTSQVYRPAPTRSSHASHGSHSHQTHHKLPVPQAYTQAIYHQPEPVKSGKAMGFTHQNQNQNHNEGSGQTQSFNVGYSVKFGNDQGQRKKPYKPTRPDSDIITGSHKEEVSKPSHLSQVTHHRFPASNQQDDQKFFSASSNNPQQILSQANLTPKTQKQLAFLENIQSHKFVQKEPLQSNFPWKNLSPSVEIYRSKEISLPSGSTFTKNYGFDHEKAIGKSEGFDYTNAVDYNGNIVKVLPTQGTQHKGYLPIPGLNTVSGEQGHETQQIQVQAQLELQPQGDSQSPYLQMSHSGVPSGPIDKIPALPKLPIDTSLIREPFLTVHKDRMQPHGTQLPIHFDTSLIKDISNAYGQIFTNDAPSAGPGSTYQENLAQINNLLAEQSQQHHNYQQLIPSSMAPHLEQSAPEQQQQHSKPLLYLQPAPTSQSQSQLTDASQIRQVNHDDMTFSYPQNGLFNPIMAMVPKPSDPTQMPVLFTPQGNIKAIDPQLLKHLKMYKVKEHVPDHAQPQMVKFKVFGKPGNAFMRHQYEKMRHGIPIRMPGGQGIPLQSGNKRLVREYTNIEMDLRPPPMAIPFKTANFIRIKQ